MLWEASLTTSSSGTGVWHPPFVVVCAVTPPVWKSGSGTLRHKDCHVSLENVDLKGRRKLLAKARINLTDYYEAKGPVAFKLKLRPESTKVEAASVNFSVEKTETDPRVPVENVVGTTLDDDVMVADVEDIVMAAHLEDDVVQTVSLDQIGSTSPVQEDEVALPSLPPQLPPRDWERGPIATSTPLAKPAPKPRPVITTARELLSVLDEKPAVAVDDKPAVVDEKPATPEPSETRTKDEVKPFPPPLPKRDFELARDILTETSTVKIPLIDAITPVAEFATEVESNIPLPHILASPEDNTPCTAVVQPLFEPVQNTELIPESDAASPPPPPVVEDLPQPKSLTLPLEEENDTLFVKPAVVATVRLVGLLHFFFYCKNLTSILIRRRLVSELEMCSRLQIA